MKTKVTMFIDKLGNVHETRSQAFEDISAKLSQTALEDLNIDWWGDVSPRMVARELAREGYMITRRPTDLSEATDEAA